MKIVSQKLPRSANQAPKRSKLLASNYTSLSEFTGAKKAQYENLLDAKTIQHLINQYGSELDNFIEFVQHDPELLQAISSNSLDIVGQIVWAVEHEQTLTVNDLLFNRTSLGLLGVEQNTVNKVTKLMGKLLGWSEQEQLQQARTVQQKLANTRAALDGHDH